VLPGEVRVAYIRARTRDTWDKQIDDRAADAAESCRRPDAR
jgi:hypothetical protein